MEKGKKLIIVGILVLIVIGVILIISLKNNEAGNINNPDSKVDITPVNNQVNLEEIFKEIEKIEGMTNNRADRESNVGQKESGEINRRPENAEEKYGLEQSNPEDETENLKQSNPEDEIDFGKYKALEKKAIVNTTDDNVNEVWMIKLGDSNQQEDVCRILGRRIQKLKNAFRDDELQTRILNDAVIKQEDGIVIMIVSSNKNEIEKTIGNLMN